MIKNISSEIGNSSGKLIFKKLIGKDKYGHSLIECECECGGIKLCSYSDFSQFKIKSCGCFLLDKDKTNKKFGSLLAVKRLEKRGVDYYWECKCDCGNTVKVLGGNLDEFRKGCKECIKRDKQSRAKYNKQHPLYHVFRHMKERCYKSYCKEFPNYGGRGISVCEEWLTGGFEVFRDWAVKNGWKKGLTIDRIDVNGNYCPENCRWVTTKENCNNKRNNKRVTVFEETLTFSQAVEKYGVVSYATALNRVQKGWGIEKALTTPLLRGYA